MYHRAGRVMLGGQTSADCIIYKHVVSTFNEMKDNAFVPMPDCEIRFHLGTRPVILHNNTSDDDTVQSMDEYEGKLRKIREMVQSMVEHLNTKAGESFLLRDFLNPARTDCRLFGGTLLIHYSFKWKNITFDISDCSVKNRKSWGKDEFLEFAGNLTGLIDEALSTIPEIKQEIERCKK